MKIILPHSWEYRFSAQSSIMTPSSSGFTVDRSSSPVASDIRISLDTNVPPSSSAVRSKERGRECRLGLGSGLGLGLGLGCLGDALLCLQLRLCLHLLHHHLLVPVLIVVLRHLLRAMWRLYGRQSPVEPSETIEDETVPSEVFRRQLSTADDPGRDSLGVVEGLPTT